MSLEPPAQHLPDLPPLWRMEVSEDRPADTMLGRDEVLEAENMTNEQFIATAAAHGDASGSDQQGGSLAAEPPTESEFPPAAAASPPHKHVYLDANTVVSLTTVETGGHMPASLDDLPDSLLGPSTRQEPASPARDHAPPTPDNVFPAVDHGDAASSTEQPLPPANSTSERAAEREGSVASTRSRQRRSLSVASDKMDTKPDESSADAAGTAEKPSDLGSVSSVRRSSRGRSGSPPKSVKSAVSARSESLQQPLEAVSEQQEEEEMVGDLPSEDMRRSTRGRSGSPAKSVKSAKSGVSRRSESLQQPFETPDDGDSDGRVYIPDDSPVILDAHDEASSRRPRSESSVSLGSNSLRRTRLGSAEEGSVDEMVEDEGGVVDDVRVSVAAAEEQQPGAVDETVPMDETANVPVAVSIAETVVVPTADVPKADAGPQAEGEFILVIHTFSSFFLFLTPIIFSL